MNPRFKLSINQRLVLTTPHAKRWHWSGGSSGNTASYVPSALFKNSLPRALQFEFTIQANMHFYLNSTGDGFIWPRGTSCTVIAPFVLHRCSQSDGYGYATYLRVSVCVQISCSANRLKKKNGLCVYGFGCRLWLCLSNIPFQRAGVYMAESFNLGVV